MFDFFDTSKLLIIGAVALMVIPPKDLPSVLRQLGQAVGKLRRMATDFQNQFSEALKDAEFDSLKKELNELQSSTNMPMDIGTDFNTAAPAPESVVSSQGTSAPAPISEPVVEIAASPEVSPDTPVVKKAKRRAENSSKAVANADDAALVENEPVPTKPKRVRKSAANVGLNSETSVNKDRETNV